MSEVTMQPSFPEISEQTKLQYTKKFKSIFRKHFDNSWDKVSCKACLHIFNDSDQGISNATLRIYKAAFLFCLKNKIDEMEGGEEKDRLHEIFVELKTIKPKGLKSTGIRAKKISHDDIELMVMFLNAANNPTYDIIAKQMYFTSVFGLRPNEWHNCDLQFTTDNHTNILISLQEEFDKETISGSGGSSNSAGEKFLKILDQVNGDPELLDLIKSFPKEMSLDLLVKNSKISHGRSNGAFRRILLGNLIESKTQLVSLAVFILTMRKIGLDGNSISYMESAKQIVRRQNIRINAFQIAVRNAIRRKSLHQSQEHDIFSLVRHDVGFRKRGMSEVDFNRIIRHIHEKIIDRKDGSEWFQKNEGKTNFYRLTLYSARHRFSATAKAQLSQQEVAALMGHASMLTAGRHYARPLPDDPRGKSLLRPAQESMDGVRPLAPIIFNPKTIGEKSTEKKQIKFQIS